VDGWGINGSLPSRVKTVRDVYVHCTAACSMEERLRSQGYCDPTVAPRGIVRAKGGGNGTGSTMGFLPLLPGRVVLEIVIVRGPGALSIQGTPEE
jgi:hypothetical protein